MKNNTTDNTPSSDETSSEKQPEKFGGQKGPEPELNRTIT